MTPDFLAGLATGAIGMLTIVFLWWYWLDSAKRNRYDRMKYVRLVHETHPDRTHDVWVFGDPPPARRPYRHLSRHPLYDHEKDEP